MARAGAAILHCLAHKWGIANANTQTTASERECLARYAALAERAVEIGVYEGVTTSALAESMRIPGAELYAIDPFLPGRLGISWGEQIAKQELRRHKITTTVKFVKGFSYDVVRELEGPFDFVFIDGDHSLEGIRRDWHDWSTRVRRGGVMALHDTSVPNHDPNVASLGSYHFYVTEIVQDKRYEHVERVDSLNVLRRLP